MHGRHTFVLFIFALLSTRSAHCLLLSTDKDNRHSRRSSDSCALKSVEYESSLLEKQWLGLANSISSLEEYCEVQRAFMDENEQWLQRASGARLSAHSIVTEWVPDPIFSSFIYTWRCRSGVTKTVSLIEPLAGALRHPYGWCDATMELRYDFLVPAVADAKAAYTGKNFLFDLGARTFDIGVGLSPTNSSLSAQRYLTETYENGGLTFDRMLLWEAAPSTASMIWKAVPEKLYPVYQYMNVAASDGNDMTNPFNILQKLCEPNDFVVVKLDIDNPTLESQFLHRLKNDDNLIPLIDELFYEWNPISEVAWSTMPSAYESLLYFRSRGVRAHGWI